MSIIKIDDMKAQLQESSSMIIHPFASSNDFNIMLVTGVNNDQMFHINTSEELLVQIEGSMVLEYYSEKEKTLHRLHLNRGECYLIPAGVPHRPLREQHSVGLVVEKKLHGNPIQRYISYAEMIKQTSLDSRK